MKGLSLGLSLTGASAAGESLGPELITNGTFDTATTGWSADANASQSSVSGQLRLTAVGAGNIQTGQTIFGLEIGETYRFQATMIPHEASRARIVLTTGLSYDVIYSETVGGAVSVDLVATATGADVSLRSSDRAAWVSVGEYATFDNISLKKVL